MRKLILLALFLLSCVPLEAQDFRHRYFHYNQEYTPSSFSITALTQNGADNKLLYLSGGGDTATARGSTVLLTGNESSGAGKLSLYAGDEITDGNIKLYTGNSLLQWTVPYQGAATVHTLMFGDGATAAQAAYIMANKVDGSDSDALLLSGGGGIGTTRGGYIILAGADYGGAGSGGDVEVKTGVAGDLTLNANNGYIYFNFANDQKWQVYPTGAGTTWLTFGDAVPATQWNAVIFSRTTDGDDDARLTLTAGGGVGSTRGGRIDLYGADRGGAGNGGDVNIYSADDGDIMFVTIGSGDIVLDASGATGYIDFSTNGAQHWFISPNGSLYSDPAAGGNLVFERAGYGITEKADVLAVAGNSQATAAAVVNRVTFVTGADGVAGRGVRLPATPAAGDCYRLFNTVNNTFETYPGAGDTINTLAANTSVVVTAIDTIECCANSASQWFCGLWTNP